MNCNKCGYALQSGAGFCLICGTATAQEQTVVPVQVIQPVYSAPQPQQQEQQFQQPQQLQPQQQQFQPQPQQQPVQKRKWSGGTATGLVLGIIGIVVGFFSWPLLGERSWFGVIFSVIAVTFGLIALICGISGLRKKTIGAGGGMATGIIALCFGFLGMMIFLSCNLNWTF
ncbi:MAG: hypothetical protein FWC11_05190 [Firmicutes bacterium]|nr:hypothetical protein [Bacillota bacterium]